MYEERLVVPSDHNLQTELIREAHDQISTAHPGREKTHRILRKRYYWRGMLKSIAQYIRNCHPCQRAHIPRDKTPGFLRPLEIPDRPWQHITMDYKSFPVDKDGNDNIFVVMDRLTKKSISIPCTKKDATSLELAKMFIRYVYLYYGLPDTIVSNRGLQFISDLWDEFNRILGVKIKLSTAHKATTDGQTEIMNQYIDQRLRPYVNHYQDNWGEMLPMIDFAQYTLPSEATGMSGFFMQNGYDARMSFDWNTPKSLTPREKLSRQEAVAVARRMEDGIRVAKEIMCKSQERMAANANRGRRPVDWTVGEDVWLTTNTWKTDRPSKKLSNQRDGPYTVLEQRGDSFKLDLPESMKIHPVHPPERLRKAASDPLPGQRNEPSEPVIINEDEEWEVQEIIASKKLDGKICYKASWIGQDPDPTYYPAGNFKYSPHELRKFHARYPTKPGPPRSLDRWTELYEEGLDEYEDENDERPMEVAQETRKSARKHKT